MDDAAWGAKASFVVAPSGAKRLFSSPGTLDRWRLNGLLIPSDPCSAFVEDVVSGGVPASAAVELMDCGVPADGDSTLLRYGDLRFEPGSPISSAECCRLSCDRVSIRQYH